MKILAHDIVNDVALIDGGYSFYVRHGLTVTHVVGKADAVAEFNRVVREKLDI